MFPGTRLVVDPGVTVRPKSHVRPPCGGRTSDSVYENIVSRVLGYFRDPRGLGKVRIED